MQHISTYNSHLQANLRTVIALQVGCVHLGSQYGLQCFAAIFYTQCDLSYQLVLHKRTSAQSIYSRVRLHVSTKCQSSSGYYNFVTRCFVHFGIPIVFICAETSQHQL